MNAEVAVIKTAAETALAQTFAQVRDRLPGDEAVAARRNAAFDLFAKQGLPHRRIEEWKYTDLRALMREAKPLAGPPDAAAKAGQVTLFRVHPAMALGGKGYLMMAGSVSDVKVAVGAAAQVVRRKGLLVSAVTIPGPSRELFAEYL